jgi:hypothetical protein
VVYTSLMVSVSSSCVIGVCEVRADTMSATIGIRSLFIIFPAKERLGASKVGEELHVVC